MERKQLCSKLSRRSESPLKIRCYPTVELPSAAKRQSFVGRILQERMPETKRARPVLLNEVSETYPCLGIADAGKGIAKRTSKLIEIEFLAEHRGIAQQIAFSGSKLVNSRDEHSLYRVR